MISALLAVALSDDLKLWIGAGALAVGIAVSIWYGTTLFQQLPAPSNGAPVKQSKRKKKDSDENSPRTERAKRRAAAKRAAEAPDQAKFSLDDYDDIGDRESALASVRSKVVDEATRVVTGRDSGVELQHKLEVSGSKLRAGEWLLIVGAITLFVSGVVFMFKGPLFALIGLVAVPLIAWIVLKRNVSKRRRAFADQLPDILQLISSGLRAGQSLPQAIAGMAPEIASPGSEELKRVIIENRIGRDLTDSFRDLAERMDSLDFEWVVSAIHINRSVGGDLSRILRRLESTIRARNRVAGQVRALSAEGRISGLVLTLLPPGMMIIVQVVNPGFMDVMFTTGLGRILMIGATTQLIIGGLWLNKLSQFKF